MGFLEQFKCYLVLGRFLGFVYFPDEKKRFLVFLWISPYVIVYLYGTINGLMFLYMIFDQDKIERLGNFGIIFLGHAITISRIFCYYIKRNSFQKLLEKLDEFNGRLETKESPQKTGRKCLIFFVSFVLLLTNDLFNNYIKNEPFSLLFLFTVGLSMLLFHQFFIHEILNGLLEQLEFINGNILKATKKIIRNQNDFMEAFQRVIDLRQESFEMCEEANKFFGFITFLNTTLFLIMFTLSIYYLKVNLFKEDYLGILSIEAWAFGILAAFIWFIKQLTSIEKEVCLVFLL